MFIFCWITSKTAYYLIYGGHVHMFLYVCWPLCWWRSINRVNFILMKANWAGKLQNAHFRIHIIISSQCDWMYIFLSISINFNKWKIRRDESYTRDKSLNTKEPDLNNLISDMCKAFLRRIFSKLVRVCVQSNRT